MEKVKARKRLLEKSVERVHSYKIGNVKYIVGSQFNYSGHPKDDMVTMKDRIGSYLKSELTELPNIEKTNIIPPEYVCSVAAEEEA